MYFVKTENRKKGSRSSHNKVATFFATLLTSLVLSSPALAARGDVTTIGNPGDFFAVAVDTAGNVYAHDGLLTEITPSGQSLFLAGGAPTAVDGTGAAAGLGVGRIAADATGNIYLAERDTNKVRKISPGGVVTTLAGSGQPGRSNGSGAAASFEGLTGIAVGPGGDIFVAEALVAQPEGAPNTRIRKITPSGVVSTVIETYNSVNGSLAVDNAGNLYFGNLTRVQKVTPNGVESTYAGTVSGLSVPEQNGGAADARFSTIRDLVFDGSGNLFVVQFQTHRIRKIAPNGDTTNFAGTGSPGFVNGNGTSASFNNPGQIAADQFGNLFVADFGNRAVRKIELIDVTNGTVPIVDPKVALVALSVVGAGLFVKRRRRFAHQV